MLYGVDQCKLKDRSVSLVVQAVQLVSTVVHLVCTVQAVSQVSQDLDFPSFLRNGRISCHFFFVDAIQLSYLQKHHHPP